MQITMEAVEIAEVLEDDDNSLESEPPTKKLKGLAAILTKVGGDGSRPDTSSMSPSQKVDRESQAYLEKPVIETNDDPLSWWSSEKAKLPILAEQSRKYLCICGTSVPSEHLFSKAGLIVSDLQNRLSPETVNMLLFLARNMS